MTNKKINILLLLVTLPVLTLFSQQSRLDALGGLSYSILDIDSQLDPFILGGNPAWLVNSQTEQRLEISPYGSNSTGDYHRYLESGDINNYGIDFMGIKPLGTSGTFLGTAGYNYQMQKDRNRALTLSPYSGEAYFFTDTTSGDFTYSGPTFEFMHSLELFENFYFGASVNYQILDGLKKVYTYAQTLYRNVSGNIGIAYKLNEKYSVGFNYRITDSQERIEASDVNLFTILTNLYRGETYKVELRGSSQDFKLKKNGNAFSGQIYMNPVKEWFIGINVKYYSHNSSILIPQSSIVDFEDGFSSFGLTDIKLQSRWIKSESLVFGFTGGYTYDNSWTRNSINDLLLWEWDISDAYLGVGATWGNLESSGYIIGLEYEAHNISADSSKYIDNKTVSISGLNHIARIGIETYLNNYFSFRIGYNFIFKEHDFVLGGNNVSGHYFTFGTRVILSEAIEFEPRFEYSTTNLSENDLYKNNYGIYATLRFYKF